MRTGYPILRFYGEWDLSLFDRLNRYRRVARFEEGKEYVLLSRNANRIFSDKGGKFLLTEDDDQQNTTFRISGNGKGQYLLVNTKTNAVLGIEGDQLCWTDSTGGNNQLWTITSAGNDGYYYLSPATKSNTVLSNLCATPTANGIVGLAKAGNNLSNRFAFCFDSKKHNYTPISDESDGSYHKWMESLGYEQTSISSLQAETASEPSVLVGMGQKSISIKSLKDQTVSIYNANGQLVWRQRMRTGETTTQPLPAGIYVVNNVKAVVGN